MDIEYDFIPQEISIGKFNQEFAFVSCKYNYEKWTNMTIFERLCGFKPYEQKDPEKELKKAIQNAVEICENIPMSGFKFIDYDKDLYKLNKKLYDNNVHDVLIKDPRGFIVSISYENFYYMLKTCNGNIDNFVFKHKFAYAWDRNKSIFIIIDAESEKFLKCKMRSNVLKDKITSKRYIMPKDLKIGHIYLGTNSFPGRYMYLGKMDTYNVNYHIDALRNNSYKEIKSFIKEKKYYNKYEIRENVHVLYRIGLNIKFKSSHPFVFRSSMSKIFEKEIDSSEIKERMFNDKNKFVTYENVKEYVETCPLFNKIDLTSVCKGEFGKKCDYDLFELIMKNSNFSTCLNVNTLVYPFYSWELKKCMFFISGKKYVYIIPYVKSDVKNKLSFDIIENKNLICNFKEMTIRELYDRINPYVATAKYENGKDVKELYMLLFFQRYFDNSVYA